MREELSAFARERRDVLYAFLGRLFARERDVLSQPDVRRAFDELVESLGRPELRESPLSELVRGTQEAYLHHPWVVLTFRERVGLWHHLRIHVERLEPEELPVAGLLAFQESLVGAAPNDVPVLEIDLAPFNRGFPRLTEARSIGQGVILLHRQLASALFDGRGEGYRRLLEFLSLHALEGQTLLVHTTFQDVASLRTALRRALSRLEKLEASTPWPAFADALGKHGFAPGWGDTAARVAETMGLLVDLLEAPAPEALEAFLARVPMISRLLVLSPHGYFGQDDVLGLPDTGGQVVYILDQVRALERVMRERLSSQGVSVEPRILIVTRLIPECGATTCNQRLERVSGCRSSAILRVPFRRENGEVVPRWISRFEVWPFLERFARDVEREALAELGARPDVIIGNYSDGSLVASLLSQRLGVTQCNIAHALEITKYPLSGLRWKEYEARYHFSCQYTADLIAMNTADFILTSTYQEIAGTETSAGQYERYAAYTLPGLYRVLSGIDLFDPKFNVVSPGADPEVYFPFSDRERRLTTLSPALETLVYGSDTAPVARGSLGDRGRTLIFTMARLDRIKNLTGLVEWYGQSGRLRRQANLLVVGGSLDAAESADPEEREEIGRMHALFDRHRLEGDVRWVGKRLDRNLAGELYRFVADRRGVFVQPALYEAFGLTVVEAMTSGLPTFATRYGGPSEILEEGRSGFHLDTHDGRACADRIADFLERCAEDPGAWDRVSRAAIERVEARYTWKRYARRVLSYSCLYGFWKFVSNLERQETARYLHMLYQLQLRPLAASLSPAG